MEKRKWKGWLWPLLFCSFCLVVYSYAMKVKNKEREHLSFRLQTKEKEILIALSEKEDLKLELASQNDPSWIEMLLIRDLGVVPEGWLKVHFL